MNDRPPQAHEANDMVIQISIPRCPVGPNGRNGLLRIHWAKRRKLKQEWQAEILFAVREKLGLPAACSIPLDKRKRVIIRQYRKRLFDRDNLFASCKPILDSMKGLLIADDSEKHCALQVYQEKADKHGERTEITVEDI